MKPTRSQIIDCSNVNHKMGLILLLIWTLMLHQALPKTDNFNVRGPGVGETTPASIPARFKVLVDEGDNDDLDVFVKRPDETVINPYVRDNLDDTYDVYYIPEDLGTYEVTVMCPWDCPASTYKVNATPTGDASKCMIIDGGDRTVAVGEDKVITVDAAQAGFGKVTCRIKSFSGSEINMVVSEQDNKTFFTSFIPEYPGSYSVSIKFGGRTVPNGSYVVQAQNPETKGDKTSGE